MGDRHRIPRCKDKSYSDPEFEKVLRDSDKGRLKHNLSSFHTRPAFAYTRAAVGGISNDLQNVRRVNPLTDF